MDAVSSFSYLVDNIPTWRGQVSQLSAYTSQKHDEFKAEYARLCSQARPKRVKSPSVSSIKTKDDADRAMVETQPDLPLQPPDPVEISPFEAGNRYIYAQAMKKRNPETSFRSGASGPMKFRSKQMVVIYYDSRVQEQLEGLVKVIGGSRNNLRKGKMAYTASKGFQLPTLRRGHDFPSSIPGLDGIRSTTTGRIPTKLPHIKGLIEPTANSELTGEAAFKQADKDLETCQNLCETAAHQFLRDGDCRLELDTVVINLDKVLNMATTALRIFKAEEIEKNPPDDIVTIANSPLVDSETTFNGERSNDILQSKSKLGPSILPDFGATRPPLPGTVSAPPMMAIEIDDDDDDQSSIEINIGTYRRTNRDLPQRLLKA